MSAPAPEIARGLDPRTKLAAAALAGIAVMTPGGLRFVVPALLLGVGLAIWQGNWTHGVALAAISALAWALGWLLPALWLNGLTAFVSSVCVYTIRFLAILGIGLHPLTTTSPTQLTSPTSPTGTRCLSPAASSSDSSLPPCGSPAAAS